jgi:DNA-binding transcriptional regulator YhcF (GntR family)
MKKTQPSPSVKDVRELAARAECSENTARKALTEGVDAIRGENLRNRLREAMKP